MSVEDNIAGSVMAFTSAYDLGFEDDVLIEIVDPAAIPREYLAIDEKKIRAYVKAMKSDAKIPGVRVFAKDVIAARAAK